MKVPKNYVPIREKKITVMRYRLYADGTVIDQENNNQIVGYILERHNLDTAYRLGGKRQQKFIRTYFSID